MAFQSDSLAREYCEQADHAQLQQWLPEIQSRLLDVGSHIATPQTSSKPTQLKHTEFDPAFVEQLEKWIDEMDESLPALQKFILPSGGQAASTLHVCRSVARRAERHLVPLVGRCFTECYPPA